MSDFYKAGLVSADVNRHYGNLCGAEIEYSPSGVPSHLCVGLATTAHQGRRSQACDTPGTTVWIVDTTDSPGTATNGSFPLVNCSTEDFTHPFAMTCPRHAHRYHDAQIRVRHLVGNPEHVPDNQLRGVLKQRALRD